jgi:glutaredoxin 3
MLEITMYTTSWCGYCVRAKILLESLGLPYEEISMDNDPHFRQRLFDLTGGWTVPQIVIDGRPIGGYVELWKLEREGKLAA